MYLAPLYRVRMSYPESWSVDVKGRYGTEGNLLLMAEGRCEGRIQGRLRGTNHARTRPDSTFLGEMHGVIETDDGATLIFTYHGLQYGVEQGVQHIVGMSTHVADDRRYHWLNAVVCVVSARLPVQRRGSLEFEIDVEQLLWDPPSTS